MSDERINDYEVIQKDKNTLKLFVESNSKESYSLAKEALIKIFSMYKVYDLKFIMSNKSHHINGNKKRRIKNEYTE